jgi:hypothetical protein
MTPQQPATRLWTPSGKRPSASDFIGNPRACGFSSLWDAIEDVGDDICNGERPNGHDPWIKCGGILLDEMQILLRYENSIGHPDARRVGNERSTRR